MVELRLLDGQYPNLSIHGWLEHQPYAAHHKERSEQARKAAAAGRAKRAAIGSAECTAERSAERSAERTTERTAPSPVPLPAPVPAPVPLPNNVPCTETFMLGDDPGNPTDSQQAEKLYKLYPRHEAKADALRAISKALQSIPFGVLEAAVVAYAKARSAPGNERQFTPLPATWFNKGRWDDDQTEWEKPDGSNGKKGGYWDPNADATIALSTS